MKHVPVDELFAIISDKEKLKAYQNEDFGKLRQSMASKPVDFIENLPYEEIRSFVEERKDDIFSKLDENERRKTKWEHIGSTSIRGMPGTKNPDACLIIENFPPSKEILKALQDSSFHFVGRAAHMSDDHDLWFLRMNSEEGFLKGTIMAIHLVDEGSTSAKILLDVRDTCNTDKQAFDEYKENKLNAAKESQGIFDYKRKKAEASFITKIRAKYSLEAYDIRQTTYKQ